MFNTIIVMLKSITRIIWRVYVDTFDLTGEVLFKSTKSEQIVAVNKHIARPRFPIGKRAGFDLPKTIFRSVKEQTRFYGKRLILFANPRKLQFILSLFHC